MCLFPNQHNSVEARLQLHTQNAWLCSVFPTCDILPSPDLTWLIIALWFQSFVEISYLFFTWIKFAEIQCDFYLCLLLCMHSCVCVCVCVCRWGFWVASSRLDQHLVNRTWQSTAHKHFTVSVLSPKVSFDLSHKWYSNLLMQSLTSMKCSFICQVLYAIGNVSNKHV